VAFADLGATAIAASFLRTAIQSPTLAGFAPGTNHAEAVAADDSGST